MRARLVLTALEQFEEPAVYEDEAGEQVADEGVDCVVVNHHEPPVVPLQRAGAHNPGFSSVSPVFWHTPPTLQK